MLGLDLTFQLILKLLLEIPLLLLWLLGKQLWPLLLTSLLPLLVPETYYKGLEHLI
ncbi:unnamed protein product (mitochondrion) [Musa banksii]